MEDKYFYEYILTIYDSTQKRNKTVEGLVLAKTFKGAINRICDDYGEENIVLIDRLLPTDITHDECYELKENSL